GMAVSLDAGTASIDKAICIDQFGFHLARWQTNFTKPSRFDVTKTVDIVLRVEKTPSYKIVK
ncbi:MAG: hypothetical protein AAFY57_10455, partial [Cyanobacteria bacterium J06642_2]